MNSSLTGEHDDYDDGNNVGDGYDEDDDEGVEDEDQDDCDKSSLTMMMVIGMLVMMMMYPPADTLVHSTRYSTSIELESFTWPMRCVFLLLGKCHHAFMLRLKTQFLSSKHQFLNFAYFSIIFHLVVEVNACLWVQFLCILSPPPIFHFPIYII